MSKRRVLRSPFFALFLLSWVAALTLAGCSAQPGFSLAELFGTPTPIATPTPPTPTATSIPTPTPTPTPEPLRIEVAPQPPEVTQGGVLTVVVRANRPMTALRGDISGRPLSFLREGSLGWSLVGFRSDANPGPKRISVVVETAGDPPASASATIEVLPGNFRIEHIRLPPGQGALLDPAVVNQEWAQLLALTRQATPEKRWSGTFLLPAQGRTSSPYGARRGYNGGPPGSPHEGLDIAAEAGEPVVAANHGIVVLARAWKVRGNAVIVDHGMGVYSGYYHLSETLVAEGQRVSRGELIGRVGASGLATGAHLHWDMVLAGVHTAPLEWTRREFP